MLKTIIFIIVCWLFGIFGFAQIIGSIQHARERGAITIVTIVSWVPILTVVAMACNHFGASWKIIGICYAIAFILNCRPQS